MPQFGNLARGIEGSKNDGGRKDCIYLKRRRSVDCLTEERKCLARSLVMRKTANFVQPDYSAELTASLGTASC